MKKKTLLSIFCLTICNLFIFLKIKTLIAGKNLPSRHQASPDLIRWPTKFISRWNFQLVVYFLIVFMPQPLRIIFVLTLCCITFSMNMNMKWIYIYNGFIYPSEHLIRWFTTLSVLAISASSRFLYRSSHVKLKI